MAEKDEKKETKEAALDPKYLKGIKFSGANHEEISDKKTGKKKMVHTPFERPAVISDVAAWKDYGDYVVIGIKDGRKYEVKK